MRDKIKLVSTLWYWLFLHHHQEQAHYAWQNGNQKI